MSPIRQQVTVHRILYSRAGGGSIFSARNAEGATIRAVAGESVLQWPPALGETLLIAGRFQSHAQYGEQFVVETCQRLPPRGRLVVSFLSTNPAFQGIGPARAQALWDRFGERLVSLLDDNACDQIAIVLGDALAQTLLSAWQEQRLEGQVVQRLDSLGFDVRLARRLIRVWGVEVVVMLERNPYYMLAFTSWKAAEAAAGLLGLAKDDPRRLVGAVESIAYEQLDSGHTVVPAPLLKELLGGRVGHHLVEQAIRVAADEGAIVEGPRGGWQASGASALERSVECRLAQLQEGRSLFDVPGGSQSKGWVDQRLDEAVRDLGFRLTEQQRQVAHAVINNRVVILVGGAGTGKTAALRAVLAVASAAHLVPHLVALAGRAARRMAEATGRPATTIAKLLMLAKNGKAGLSPSSLLVVDEASMLDLPTLHRLLVELPDGARLLLVGDPAQLAPIGFGLTFHRLVLVDSIPRVELTAVHRQAESTGIPKVASDIRQHVVPQLDEPRALRSTGVSKIDCAPGDTLAVLKRLAQAWDGDDWRIVVAVKAGPAGADLINEEFHRANVNAVEGNDFAVDDPVVHLHNDPEADLYNGTLGVVTAVEHDGVVVQFEQTKHRFDLASAGDSIALGYALSCHKVQGSQFKRVAVVVRRSRVLDHAWVYTALTRGVEQIVFVGDRSALADAVRNPPLAGSRRIGLMMSRNEGE